MSDRDRIENALKELGISPALWRVISRGRGHSVEVAHAGKRVKFDILTPTTDDRLKDYIARKLPCHG